MSLGGRGRRAAVVIRAGTLALVHLVALVVPALAASPSPTTGIGGDPRSSGQGPGLVGDPFFAIVAVLAIAVTAVALTLAYVRLTDRRS